MATKQDVLAIDAVAGLTVQQVARRNASLYKTLQGRLAGQRKSAVLSAFKGASSALTGNLEKINYAATLNRTDVAQVVLTELQKQDVSADVAKEAADRLIQIERSAALVDPASLQVSISEHPAFQEDLQKAALYKLADIAQIPANRQDKLVAALPDLASVTDRALEALVASKTLTDMHAKKLGLATSVLNLADRKVSLATVLRSTTFASLRNRKLAGPEDLARLSVDDWSKAITQSKVERPAGLSAQSYAEQLSATAQGVFPTAALIARVVPAGTRSQTTATRTALKHVAPLLKVDPHLLAKPIAKIDTSKVAKSAVPKVREAAAHLQRLANLHPGLELHKVISGSASEAQKVKVIAERVGLLGTVVKQNPGMELLALDYSPGSEDVSSLRLNGLSAGQKSMALANLKAHQRAYVLAGDVNRAVTLLERGYDSSMKIAAVPFKEFRTRTGFANDVAEHYYKLAKANVAQVSTTLGSIIDIVNSGGWSFAVDNVPPSVQDYLKHLNGFSELFGTQGYCNCRHCQSIFSPAAYFVDLMRFVEEHVSNVYFLGSKASDPLHLKTRRPDLWTLPLTCENTDTLIPYLDIINEILENAIAHGRGYSGDLTDRRAVEDVVYHQLLASDTDSLQQPFSLPLAKLDSYLRYFERPRSAIARVMTADPVTLAIAALKLSQREYDLITHTNTAKAFLSQLFGISFSVGSGGKVSPFDAQLLLKYTGLTRAELGALVATHFVSPGSPGVEIHAEESSPASVQNDIERVRNLTTAALDRIHRFIRLWRKLGWTIAEVDLLLTQLDAAGVAGGIGADTLAALVKVLPLVSRWQLPIEHTCALWSDIPQTALPGASASLFDRLFNFAPFVLVDGTLPKDAVKFVHPSFRQSGTPQPADSTLQRLVAGLQVTSDELASLIKGLAGPLGANFGTSNEADRGFALSVANLTLLYRHARLAQLLRVAVNDLFALIGLAGISPASIASLDDLTAFLVFVDWWQGSGFKLDDLQFITRGPVARPTSYPDKDAVATQIVTTIGNDKSLQFADTVFAFLPGITEDQSRAIIAANAALVEPSPDGTALRLVASFDPTATLTIPAGLAVTPTDARATLLKYHVSQVLPAHLASRLGGSVDKMDALLTMIGADLSAAALVHAVEGGPVAPLVDILDRVLPLTVLFRNDVFDADALAFVHAHAAIFAISDFATIGIDAVRKTSVYVSLTDTSALVDYTADGVIVDPASVQAAFAGFDPTHKFANVDHQTLAAALRIEVALVNTLLPHLTLPATAPEALDALGSAVALARYLGVGGDALALAISTDYDDLGHAAQAVLSAFRAKFTSEKDFLDAFTPYEDEVRSRRRDGLTDALIRTVSPDVFQTRDQLYDYYLVDVQLEGCARTSRLVAAISSVQLYIYRVLMNLEQDRRAASDPQHTHVSPTSIPTDEWSWRQNYRVWEANRKVFLYPESYIEPELRDNKTPLFKDLEDTLLQTQMNEQNVLDAYSGYLNGFDEISKLRIAGAYHDKHPSSQTDMLHLFGVTPGDPPTYYYRTVENAYYGETSQQRGIVYHPWRKLDVQISSDRVSPIVYLGRLFVFWTDVTTTPKNQVSNGGSKFIGYKHRLTLKYTMLRLDETWTPPQAISLSDPSLFTGGDGIVDDPLAEKSEEELLANAILHMNVPEILQAMKELSTPKFDTHVHTEPLDGYTLTGFQWNRVYPQVGFAGSLTLTGRNFLMRAGVDFYERTIDPRSRFHLHSIDDRHMLTARDDSGLRHLYSGSRPVRFIDDYAECSIVADMRHLDRLEHDEENATFVPLFKWGLCTTLLATIDSKAEVDIINGSVSDAILDSSGDLVLVQKSVRPNGTYLIKRVSTTLGETLSRTLFTGGVNTLLATDTQSSLGEAALPLTDLHHIDNAGNAGTLDFKGPLGTYYREIFFHIPFLIGNQLNSQQRFSAAQQWYRYIFDPTADDDVTVPPGLPPAEQAKRERDRVWRYLEFRGLDVPTMRQILTDPATIEVYKKDPFNPHAIARLRLSAYQKSIVMKYVGNLLDWGDSLFSQFTMESVNEATMLYVIASEILGPRPPELGDCGEGAVQPRDYATIAPLVANGSEFLAEVESWTVVRTPSFDWAKTYQPHYVVDDTTTGFYMKRAAETVHVGVVALAQPAPAAGGAARPAASIDGGQPAIEARMRTIGSDAKALTREQRATVTTATRMETEVARFQARAELPSYENGLAHPYGWQNTIIGSWTGKVQGSQVIANDSPLITGFERIPAFGWSFARQLGPVFCVPPNLDLLAYWDRVEDRLFKIRHCRDITGAKRQLALFAPEIDPRLLVRAKAAGLSLEDVLNATGGSLPPYRFTYLIDKAKQYAGIVESFGSQLLSAIEKRDTEELGLLRTVHQQNLLKMSTKMRQDEVETATDTIQSLQRQRDAVQFRHDYYANLVASGLTPWETTQQVARHTASGLSAAAGLLDTLAGISHLVPQLGSPFAMKYGGLELGHSASSWSGVMRDASKVAEAVSASAGLEASFQRRSEGWKYQVDLADRELKQLDQQITIAQIRQDIAQRSLEVHKKTIDQVEEIYELLRSRFTNLALYTWLSSSLQRLYREAYDSAYAMAKLADEAFRFERGDDATPGLDASYWDPAHAGLHAGEGLMGALQALERRFIETNDRTLEIDQAFSLTQIAPAALVQLRETAECDFEIPELFFDLAYPGQYRRRIRAVRLTIPCVTGPYTNVGATLTLTSSRIRPKPVLGAAGLTDVPPRRSVAIATSTAQNDAGVFEFSFRDERYMPFEGAGAISSWHLALPKNFRPFDYATVNDVIIHVSYDADRDDVFRDKVEQLNGATEGTLLNILKNQPLGRVFSLRQDFSTSLNRLVHSPVNTQVKIEITDRYLPVFLRGQNLQVSKVKLVLRTPSGQAVNNVAITLDGQDQSGFAHDAQLGGLWSKDVTAVFAAGLFGEHSFAVKQAGDLAAPSTPGDPSALDGDKLQDVLLYAEYTLA